MKEDLVCPICKKTETHDDFFEPYEQRVKLQLERACGFKVSPVVFHMLCADCKEWVLYLASVNKLGSEKTDILKGGDDGTEKDDVQGS